MLIKANRRLTEEFCIFLGLSLQSEKQLDILFGFQFQNRIYQSVDKVKKTCSISPFVVSLKRMLVVLLIVIYINRRCCECSQLFVSCYEIPLMTQVKSCYSNALIILEGLLFQDLHLAHMIDCQKIASDYLKVAPCNSNSLLNM